MFDINLGGTKNWQGGLNAKELVCLTAFAFVFFLELLHVYNCLCVLQPKFVLMHANVMQPELCFYELFPDNSKYCKANNITDVTEAPPAAAPCHLECSVPAMHCLLKIIVDCMCLPLCLCNIVK